jgi:hypothetical protein
MRTRKRQRFARMIASIQDSATPRHCYAFVLGKVNARHPTFLNLVLGRGLEEVLLFPAASAGRWLPFEQIYKQVNGIP